MTKRDFFRIIIKLFALYAATISIFSLIPTYAGYAVDALDSLTLLLSLAVLIVIVSILLVLIFSADKIIDLLKLDRGFDEPRIDLGNLKEMNILKLAIILISGLLIIDNTPIFLNHTYLAFKDQISNSNLNSVFTYDQVDYFQYAISAVSIVIGYLMITNYTKVAKWLSKSDKKNVG
tara:strand:- start:970 stop:1500 length:531 start_codon:yes stop_codon:yes gene_type:complete